MQLKLMIFVLVIFVQDNSAALQDASFELAQNLEWLPDNLIRKSNTRQKLQPAYILKLKSISGKVGKGYDEDLMFSKAGKKRSKAGRNRKLSVDKTEFVRKITPVEVILDVEVRNNKERDDIEKILLSGRQNDHRITVEN